MHLTYFFGLGLSAFLLAKLEIQIEGPHGWAANLPTWRLENRVSRLVMGGKPLTGYHTYLLTFVAVLAHSPFFLGGVPLEGGPLLRVWSFIVLFWILEDFLWFMLNPAFGLGRFRAEHIPWHAESWVWIAPRDYWWGVPAGLGLYWASCCL